MSFLISPEPIVDSALDFASLLSIAILIFLSILSLGFIVHLRLKTRTAPHLHNFNSLWTIRILLVSFIALWSVTELLRIPLFRHNYLRPIFRTLTLAQESDICKIHIILSLGFFQPGFLVITLFLVNVSIKKKNPHDFWAVLSIFGTCLPLLLAQAVLSLFSPFEKPLPQVFHRSSVLLRDHFGHDRILCTYPLLSTIMFGIFGAVYYVSFLVSCYRVVSLVINKALRIRMYALAGAVLVPLPAQVLLMGASVLWTPDQVAYGVVAFAVFLSALASAVVGEGILVIGPIVDALDAAGDTCRWSPEGRLPQRPEEGENPVMVAVAQ